MTYVLELKSDGSGFYINEITGSQAIGDNRLVYVTATGQWALADADAVATMPVIGLTVEALVTGSKGRVLTQGYLVDQTWTWTPGDLIYASTTAGELTQTVPTGSGDQRQAVAMAVNATTLYFDPSLASVDNIGMMDYEERVEPITEPAIAQKGNAHVVVQYYTDGQNRSFIWTVTNSLWRGVEVL